MDDPAHDRPTDPILEGVRALGLNLRRLAALPAPRVALASTSLIFQPAPRVVSSGKFIFDCAVDLNRVLAEKRSYDAILLTAHNHQEESLLWSLRRAGVAPLLFVWMWDNHHHPL